jgi:hypothetical protein
VAGQAELLYAYGLWGGIKEVAAAAFIGLAAAVAPAAEEEASRGRQLVPFAVAGAATLGVLSVTGALWVALVAAPALVLIVRRLRRLWLPALVGIGALLVLALPSLAIARQFLHYASSNLLTRPERYGNLVRALRFP